MIAASAGQEPREDEHNHRTNGRDAGARDANVEFDAGPGRDRDVIVCQVGGDARDVKSVQSEDACNATAEDPLVAI
jgi:hypothetical protein